VSRGRAVGEKDFELQSLQVVRGSAFRGDKKTLGSKKNTPATRKRGGKGAMQENAHPGIKQNTSKKRGSQSKKQRGGVVNAKSIKVGGRVDFGV